MDIDFVDINMGCPIDMIYRQVNNVYCMIRRTYVDFVDINMGCPIDMIYRQVNNVYCMIRRT